MFGKTVETNDSVTGTSSKQLKVLLGLVAGLSFGMASHAAGQALLTTNSDWTGMTAGGGGIVSSAASAAFDYDGSAVNGLANPSYGAGGASTGGSLQFNTGSNNVSYTNGIYNSWNGLYVPSFWDVFDPGNGGDYNGSGRAYSGTMYLVYTVPTWSASDAAPGDEYLSWSVGLAYPGDSYNIYANGGPFSGSAVYDGMVDGQATYTETIPYTLAAFTGGGSFNFSYVMNGGNYGGGTDVATSPFYIDDLSLSPPVQARVPEPATLGILGTGLTMLTLRRRHRA